MTSSNTPSQSCHNCRRQRRKCDRSVPKCLKCITRGQECLGYQQLLRWEPGIASRGKMVGKTFEETSEGQVRRKDSTLSSVPLAGSLDLQLLYGNTHISPRGSLTDPLLQDLSYTSKGYLSYFANIVCRDLVLYDTTHHNPFRELIPLTYQYPALLQVIIANSALHMYNACQNFSDSDSMNFCFSPSSSLSSSPASSSSLIQYAEFYSDALSAKQRALYSLTSALVDMTPADIDAILAVVLLFIELELMDSGQDDWRRHVSGARTIIKTLCEPLLLTQATMSPLRSCLISNCLVFDIVGSTLTSSSGHESSSTILTEPLSLLQDAEGNHCSSFPTALLELIQLGAQLLQEDPSSSPNSSPASTKEQAARLLSSAQAFDPLAWAASIQQRSLASDLTLRTHIASAHRAAVCIYVSRIRLSIDLDAPFSDDLEPLVEDVITHLSFIQPGSELFKAIMWPAFIAGAETSNSTSQEWVANRFQVLWEVEPWGLIRGALGVLQGIWEKRRSRINGERSLSDEGKESGDWINDLRKSGVDWLIL